MKSPILRFLLVVLSVLLAGSSLGGLVFDDMYVRESGDWAAQSVAQDLFDLIVAVPGLLLSYFFARKGSRAGFFMLTGILVFLNYTFVIYTLAVHFNRFFLLYCFALALSSYSLMVLLMQTGSATVRSWFDTTRSVTAAIVYLVFFTLLFYFLWLSDIVPALVAGTIPKDLAESGLYTNPVHVIDLSFLLPGFAVTAYLLKKRHALGYLLAPTIMAFSIVMTLSIATLVVYEYTKGYIAGYAVALGMVFFAFVSVVMLFQFLKPRRHHG